MAWQKRDMGVSCSENGHDSEDSVDFYSTVSQLNRVDTLNFMRRIIIGSNKMIF